MAERSVETLDIAVAVIGCEPADLPALERLGVDELVLVDGPPDDADEAARWVDGLAQRWLENRAADRGDAGRSPGGHSYDAPR